MKKKLLIHKINSDKTLMPMNKIKVASHLDNISPSGDNKQLIIPSHDNVWKLQAHSKNPDKHSPFSVHQIDLNTLQSKKIFSNDGSVISAVSTALIHENQLYLSQIFGNFIIRLNL